MNRFFHSGLSLVLVIAFSLVGLWQPLTVQAGTDLTVSCAVAGGGCSIAPSGTPLFDETNILPGDSFQQIVTARNTGGQNGIFAVESLNLVNTDLGTGAQLSDAITIQVREGSAAGPVVLGPVSLTEFINPDPEYYLLSNVPAGATQLYYFQAEFDVNSGNEYQGLASIFDLRLGFELIPTTPGGGSPGGGGGGSGSSGGGGTSDPSTPVCTANPPSSAPSVTITNVGANTVTLTWTQVSPVTHYGLAFTRTADGAAYGAPNIGNVTSYTINGLSGGGASYSFQVFGVNDCAPGPFSGTAISAPVGGPVLAARPVGDDGQVLGTTYEEPSPSASPSGEGDVAGEVAGIADTCSAWGIYIPWILLLAQAGLILANEYYFRNKKGLTKHYITVGITLASILIFYLVRECDCYSYYFWLAWLCRWYWLVSLLLSGFLRGFSYAFIEEVPPTSPKTTTSSEAKPKLSTASTTTPTSLKSGDSVTSAPTTPVKKTDQ